jgi:hypothetical protein
LKYLKKQILEYLSRPDIQLSSPAYRTLHHVAGEIGKNRHYFESKKCIFSMIEDGLLKIGDDGSWKQVLSIAAENKRG